MGDQSSLFRFTRDVPEQRDRRYYTKLDFYEKHLISTITLTAAYECPQHDPNTLCDCPAALQQLTLKTRELLIYIDFVQCWEQYLLQNAAAFVFKDTYPGKSLFTKLNNGLSPQTFAVNFAKTKFSDASMWAPSGPIGVTIGAMIAMWDHRASAWKRNYDNKDAARRDLQACVPGTVGHGLYGPLKLNNAKYPLQLGGGLLIAQRFCRSPKGQPQHKSTIFFMPLRPRLEPGHAYVRHKLLGIRLCHEGCGRPLPYLEQPSIENYRRALLGAASGASVVFKANNDLESRVGLNHLTDKARLEVHVTDPVDGFHPVQTEMGDGRAVEK